LFRRFRHKLLYQIGLTDDPWQAKDDFVVDDLYSQDSDDPGDVLKMKRSVSNDKLLKGVKREYDLSHSELIKLRVGTPQNTEFMRQEMKERRKDLIKPQQKYKTDHDRDRRGRDDDDYSVLDKVHQQFEEEFPGKL